jgi:hypothetical protein
MMLGGMQKLCFKSILCLVQWRDNKEREGPHPITEGDFILASECRHALPGSKVNAHPPEIEAFFHLEPLMAAIGVMISFCTIWLLTVFILYQITRIALQAAI